MTLFAVNCSRLKAVSLFVVDNIHLVYKCTSPNHIYVYIFDKLNKTIALITLKFELTIIKMIIMILYKYRQLTRDLL